MLYEKCSLQFKLLYIWKNHIAGAMQCASAAFQNTNTIVSHLGMEERDFMPFLEQLLEHALVDELSWVATDNSTGKIVGIAISTDIANDYMPPLTTGTKLDAMLKLVYDLWAPYIEEMNVNKGTVLHGYLSGVLQDYQRLGILNELFRFSNTWAYGKGYKMVMGEASSQYSLNFVRKWPYLKEINEIIYENYEIDGKKPFYGIKTHEKCVLFSFPIKEAQEKLMNQVKRSSEDSFYNKSDSLIF